MSMNSTVLYKRLKRWVLAKNDGKCAACGLPATGFALQSDGGLCFASKSFVAAESLVPACWACASGRKNV